MKFGFSSLGCPDWDLDTIIAQAAEMGYDSVELRGLQGEMHLPASPALARTPEKVADRFRDAGVELICLGTSNCFHWKERAKVAEHKAQVREFIELAAHLRCPFIRVFGDEIPRYEQRDRVLVRIAEALAELAPVAAACNTTIVLENHGDFANSRDIWFILDTVSHPAVQCCWNPCHGKAAGERPTWSVPRLARRIALTHIVDGRFTDEGALDAYALPGDGTVELERFLDLLRGVGYAGHVVFEWPKLWIPTLADPERALPAALAHLKKIIEELESVKPLTAYKGDKTVAPFAPPPARPPVRA